MKRTYSEHGDDKQQSKCNHDDTSQASNNTNPWADMGNSARKTARQRIEERSTSKVYTYSSEISDEPNDLDHDLDIEDTTVPSDAENTGEPEPNSSETNNTDIPNKKVLIRDLNDKLRTKCEGGVVLMTEGVTSLDLEILNQCMVKIQGEQVFTEENDPYGEHDFGSIKHEDLVLFWKIDYYDLDMLHHSPDPSDEHVTKRVLTIMLASEY
jgi:hypothetical protein